MQIDGIKNPKVQTVHLADLPIQKAAFAVGGSQVRTFRLCSICTFQPLQWTFSFALKSQQANGNGCLAFMTLDMVIKAITADSTCLAMYLLIQVMQVEHEHVY